MTDHRVDGVLFDLLMAVMDSLTVWTDAAGDRDRGLAWRDTVTARMRSAETYVPYEELVAEAAAQLALSPGASATLLERWLAMQPWPDALAIGDLGVPYAFVTNCSAALAHRAAKGSGLAPAFVLSAEDAGRFKPHADVYRSACSRLGSEPARTLFVAGSPYDAAGARDAGLQAALVLRRHDQDVDDDGVTVLQSLAALPPLVTNVGKPLS